MRRCEKGVDFGSDKMKLVEVEQLWTLIIASKFGVDRSIRFCFIGSRKWPFYIHLTNDRYNCFALPCSRLIVDVSLT